MPYTPNPRNNAEPLDTEKAKTAAAEFRALKEFITCAPVDEVSANYDIVTADAGRTKLHPGTDAVTRTWTVKNNATNPHRAGTLITLAVENGGGTINLVAESPGVIYLTPTGVTGARTIPANCNATLMNLRANVWQLIGSGVG